jgi:hypothetical protein
LEAAFASKIGVVQGARKPPQKRFSDQDSGLRKAGVLDPETEMRYYIDDLYIEVLCIEPR